MKFLSVVVVVTIGLPRCPTLEIDWKKRRLVWVLNGNILGRRSSRNTPAWRCCEAQRTDPVASTNLGLWLATPKETRREHHETLYMSNITSNHVEPCGIYPHAAIVHPRHRVGVVGRSAEGIPTLPWRDPDQLSSCRSVADVHLQNVYNFNEY